jgi:hypothetical protein
MSSIGIAKALREDWGCFPWRGNNQRGLWFPPLAELRKLFDQKHGGQAWPDDEDGWSGDWSPTA